MNWSERAEASRVRLDKFVGAMILSIWIDSERQYLLIKTNRGDYNFNAVGDCCSRSWFEHITGICNVIGAIVLDIPELRPEEISRENIKEFDVLQNYQTKLKTNRGELFIEFRNESNGYYGGWLSFESDQYNDPIEEIPEVKELLKDY